MIENGNAGQIGVPIVLQTRHGYSLYDHLTTPENYSTTDVMKLIRAKYFTHVQGATMAALQRFLLCQDIVVETKDMMEIMFEDEELQVLPSRVFFEPVSINRMLTELFNHRSISRSSRPFRESHPSLVRYASRMRKAGVDTQVLIVRQTLNKKRVVLLQLLILAFLALASVLIGSTKKDPELGIAIGGASLAAIAALQPTLAWLFR